jgi:hypothetical protein
MINGYREYRTRDGRQVRIYATDGDGCFPIHGAVEKSAGSDRWTFRCWREDGSASIAGQSANDLIEVKKRHKRTVWLNVYDMGVDYYGAYPTRPMADANRNGPRIACIKVDLDFEEGEGL